MMLLILCLLVCGVVGTIVLELTHHVVAAVLSGWLAGLFTLLLAWRKEKK